MNKLIVRMVLAAVLLLLHGVAIGFFNVNSDLALSCTWAAVAALNAATVGMGSAKLCVYMSATSICMYLETRVGNRLAYKVFYVLHLLGLVYMAFSSTINRWFRKFRRKAKGMALTAINELSFRRQTKEALS